MFSKLAIICSLAILAVATPMPNDTSAPSCTPGPVQCCQSTITVGTPATDTLLGLLGVVVQDSTFPIGLDCSPITVIGISQSGCSGQPVCCTNNNGIVAFGCTPVNL